MSPSTSPYTPFTSPSTPSTPSTSARVGPRGLFVRPAGGDGVVLHTVVEGSGPVVVLSAGLAMAWFDWDPVAELLAAQGRTVVTFDRPGHGLSGPALAPATAAGEAHRIAGLLDALGPHLPGAGAGAGAGPSGEGDPRTGIGPVTVVGHSIAGFHVEAFARLYPERTAAVVLVDASVEEDPRTALPAAWRHGAARALGRAVTAVGLPAALGPAARRSVVRASRVVGGDPAARDLVRRCYRTGRVWRGALLENAGYLDAAAEVLALGVTHPLTVPATVLAGHDGTDGRGALRWLDRQAGLAERLGARLDVAEPAGHLVMMDRPHQVTRAILDATDPDRRTGRDTGRETGRDTGR
ncbi:alpha/beta fold hydrolase [Streptomyces sp. NPDC002602]|uniref:alpha/beta fold hydrolase n=1 Tax=Streptomyces sp. NPDC002602 TaxID=3364654 RepID=UPI0036BAAAA3